MSDVRGAVAQRLGDDPVHDLNDTNILGRGVASQGRGLVGRGGCLERYDERVDI